MQSDLSLQSRRSRRDAAIRPRLSVWARLATAFAIAVAAAVTVSLLSTMGASAATPTGVFATSEKPRTLADPDTVSVELGVKFTVAAAGVVTGVEYYSTPANGGTHVGSLWGPDGKRIAKATFPASTKSGWVSVSFATPVTVQPGKTYVASYLAPKGGYAVTENFFTKARTAGGVTFPKNAGVFAYGTGGFPTKVYKASNYYVDVRFVAGTPGTGATPVVTPTSTAKPSPSVTPTKAPTPAPTTTPTSSPTPTATPKPTTSPTPAPGGSGQKNCITTPSACGYPDETNTGVKPGVTLTRVPEDATSGPGWSWRSDIRAVETTGTGVTIQGLKIANGSIIVKHSGVTLRNVSVASTDYYPINCVYSGATRDADSCLGLTAENVEIKGTANCQAAMAFNGYTARRVYVHGCMDGFKADSNVLIEDSYVTALTYVPESRPGAGDGSHNDGLQSTASGNIVVRHTTFKLGGQQNMNAVFQMGIQGRVGSGVTIQNNLIDGGGWMLNSTPIKGIVVKDNRFTHRSSYGIGYVEGGSWTGNYWDDTLAPISEND
ncbi:DUF4082 domain-containing protein [Microbacterium jejuense]|uniref:DUF4082 domain-containing protein n=1 Tax=Microbacterium jejuense TaxID=1263637 RepID=UPI0031E7CE03